MGDFGIVGVLHECSRLKQDLSGKPFFVLPYRKFGSTFQPYGNLWGYSMVLWVCFLGNLYFFNRQSEAGYEKFGCELHTRSGLRFIIGQDPVNFQYTVASPKTRVPQDLSTHAMESISFQKASE